MQYHQVIGEKDVAKPLKKLIFRMNKDLQLLIGAKGEDSSGGVATMLRPRRAQPEEAQGRPAESEAICGNQQRCEPKKKNHRIFSGVGVAEVALVSPKSPASYKQPNH